MNKMFLSLSFVLLGTLTATTASAQTSATTYTPGELVKQDFEGFAKPFLSNYCMDCHGDGATEGGLSLDDLGPVSEVNADTWKSIWAQVSLQEMPPEDGDQPEIIDRLKLSDWIVGQLSDAMQDKGGFRDHLDPSRANFLDHDLLFGRLPEGIKLVPTSSPARIWRVTREEHITRLNYLINSEPEFDPNRPGLRARGDAVPTNHGGQLNLYFGTERIIDWQGGTVAYATAVKNVPAVLSSSRKHGFENYADFYSVNSAQSTQILGVANDIIRYMAYGPLSIANPEQITDKPETYKMDGDIRGLPSSLVYSTKLVRPVTPVIELMENQKVDDRSLRAAVDYLFEALTFRPPTREESDDYLAITRRSIKKLGKEEGVVLGLSAIFLDRDAIFRAELVEKGKPDAHGRVMLRDWELGLAVNHALRYIKPDEPLRQAILDGRMRTRADVKREVERMLADPSIRKPRVLQFFRDYFDYDLGGYICKDAKALRDSGADKTHYRSMFEATASTDRLVELVLEQDKEVLKQLLTTNKVVATKQDNLYFGTRLDKASRKIGGVEDLRAAVEARIEKLAVVAAAEDELARTLESLEGLPKTRNRRRAILGARTAVTNAKKDLATFHKAKEKPKVQSVKLTGPKIFARVSHRSFGKGSLKPGRKLATVPEGERLGILTHPSWLVSHSDAMDNHAIHRGRWIRERLLGGGIPDVPITVDAMLPDEPHHSLRERMRVTKDHRTTELNKPVDTSGEIIDSGDEQLDGEVANAIEMIGKLAESRRAEQVFVRHAFRFWMGRNETLNDAPVLQTAYRAYRDNGGSMNALITSLLTSDAFLYRTRTEPTEQD